MQEIVYLRGNEPDQYLVVCVNHWNPDRTHVLG
jgi:hypothetical protein